MENLEDPVGPCCKISKGNGTLVFVTIGLIAIAIAAGIAYLY